MDSDSQATVRVVAAREPRFPSEPAGWQPLLVVDDVGGDRIGAEAFGALGGDLGGGRRGGQRVLGGNGGGGMIHVQDLLSCGAKDLVLSPEDEMSIR